MMNWLKQKVRDWLGVDELETTLHAVLNELTEQKITAVDVNFYEPTTLIIVSKLNGGYVKVVNCDLNSIADIKEWVHRHVMPITAARHYRHHPPIKVEDFPYDMKGG